MDDALRPFVTPAVMTDPGRYAPLFEPLPADIAGVAKVAQGLLIHEHMVAGYGRSLTPEEQATVHLRRVEDLVARMVAVDDRPLTERRPPADRVAGNCRHFSVFAVAMLRSKGVPARARCGFGGYFNPGRYEDHWVLERWDAEQGRWLLTDAQIDRHQRTFFAIDFDVTDVPRDQFLIAGDAWQRCRAGVADPDTFGLTFLNEAGYWWIAANMMRDAAALGNIELLPWDVWGVMPEPEDTIDDDLFSLFDRLAELTLDPDARAGELHALVGGDERLRVPPTVRNVTLGRDEAI